MELEGIKAFGGLSSYLMGVRSLARGNYADWKLYVASLTDYNAGRLVGKWFDLDDVIDGDDFMAEVAKYLEGLTEEMDDGELREEWAIHDTDLPADLLDGEYADVEDIDKLLEIKAECERMRDDGIAEAIADAFNSIHDYHGGGVSVYDSGEDYCERFTEDTLNVPESLAYYIDYKAMWRDYSMDLRYAEVNDKLYIFND